MLLFGIPSLKAAAIAQKRTGLPIILHTNAHNRNGIAAVRVLLEENMASKKIAVGHLSDTSDMDYIKSFAKLGCYVAFDRIYDDASEEYIKAKLDQITDFLEGGYENRLLLSHDDAVFMGFCDKAQSKKPRWDFMFEHIIPRLDSKQTKCVLEKNPITFLCGK